MSAFRASRRLGALLLLGCLWTPASFAQNHAGVLVLGRISDDPKLHCGQLQPLLDYVVPRMAEVGIRSGRILMARDAQQMRSYLRRGQVDWVTETAAVAGLLVERAQARPLLLTERGGVRLYRSVFFARADSAIGGLADLRGKALALQSGASTSAYYGPAMVLLAAGLPMQPLPGPTDRPDADSVGYLFARSERNIATWVDKGVVDAGAFSDQDWDNAERLPPAMRAGLRIVHRGPPMPRAVELVRGGLDPAVAGRLRAVLLAAPGDPAAAAALRAFFDTTGFHPFDGEAQSLLRTMQEGVARVREALE